MKVVIADSKSGKSYQREVARERLSELMGLKVGDQFDGGIVGAAGYRLQITGGSDKEGFPIRAGVHGSKRARLEIGAGAGVNIQEKGERRRKGVRGEQISDEIAQLNCKVAEWGTMDLSTIAEKGESKEGKKK